MLVYFGLRECEDKAVLVVVDFAGDGEDGWKFLEEGFELVGAWLVAQVVAAGHHDVGDVDVDEACSLLYGLGVACEDCYDEVFGGRGARSLLWACSSVVDVALYGWLH